MSHFLSTSKPKKLFSSRLSSRSIFCPKAANDKPCKKYYGFWKLYQLRFRDLIREMARCRASTLRRSADDLRRHHKGKILDQVLAWVTTLHGYLSSPTGGGIRHGADLKTGVVIQPNEARLFCNLIRSYISFLMAEHARLSKT